MKKKNLLKISNFQDKELEKLIEETDAKLKAGAQKKGKMLSDRKLPNITGDKLISYIGEIKSGYEKLCAFVYKTLQPASHFPEVNTDTNNVNAEKKKAESEIYKVEKQIENLESEKNDLNVESTYLNLKDTKIKVLLMFIAEVFFNSIAFQVMGDNLLVSILIAIPITLGISELAHLVALQYKKIQNTIQRRLFLVLATLFATILFVALGYFRSIGLGKEGLSVGTLCFVIINIFIFLVAAFIHYRYSPTKEEKIKYNAYKKLKVEIDKKKAEIVQIEQNINDMEAELNEKAVTTIKLSHYAENTIEEIKKCYQEAIAQFKTSNIMNRSDRKVPECFSDPIPELEINYNMNINNNNMEETQ